MSSIRMHAKVMGERETALEQPLGSSTELSSPTGPGNVRLDVLMKGVLVYCNARLLKTKARLVASGDVMYISMVEIGGMQWALEPGIFAHLATEKANRPEQDIAEGLKLLSDMLSEHISEIENVMQNHYKTTLFGAPIGREGSISCNRQAATDDGIEREVGPGVDFPREEGIANC